MSYLCFVDSCVHIWWSWKNCLVWDRGCAEIWEFEWFWIGYWVFGEGFYCLLQLHSKTWRNNTDLLPFRPQPKMRKHVPESHLKPWPQKQVDCSILDQRTYFPSQRWICQILHCRRGNQNMWLCHLCPSSWLIHPPFGERQAKYAETSEGRDPFLHLRTLCQRAFQDHIVI